MANAETSRIPFDPGKQQLGTVYAKALLGASEKAGNTEQVLEELGSLRQDVLAALPRLRAALESPRIPVAVKERMLDQAFGSRMSRSLLNFLKVVARHGRMDCLAAIQGEAERLYNEIRGRVAATLKTATAVDDNLREQIRSRLSSSLGRDVVLDYRVDPELLGGILVRIGDTVYDGSVANRLAQLQRTTLAQAGHAIRDAADRFIRPEPTGDETVA